MENISFLRLTIYLVSIYFAAALAGCGKSDSGSAPAGGPGVLTTVSGPDMNQCNPYGQTSGWDRYSRWRMEPYHRHSHRPQERYPGTRFRYPNEGLCDCPAGTVPTCGPQGLMCVPTTGLDTRPMALWAYAYNSNGGTYSYTWSGYSSSYNGCANSVAQSCQAGQVVGDLYCQPVAVGSPFGVWVRRAY